MRHHKPNSPIKKQTNAAFNKFLLIFAPYLPSPSGTCARKGRGVGGEGENSPAVHHHLSSLVQLGLTNACWRTPVDLQIGHTHQAHFVLGWDHVNQDTRPPLT